MIFNELYSAYFNAVAAILRASLDHEVTLQEMNAIVNKYAFRESSLTIPAKLKNGDWALFRDADLGDPIIYNKPTMPLTLLQKQWLKAISTDPRIRLFGDSVFDGVDLGDVEPLFMSSDVYVFDKYLDGDDYGDQKYVENFRRILDAIRNQQMLEIRFLNRIGKTRTVKVMPDHLEYSEKDDKFRLIGYDLRECQTVNLSRIISIRDFDGDRQVNLEKAMKNAQKNVRTLVLELEDERKALERVLLHFAHFEKQVVQLDDKRYRLEVQYDVADETELVIRVMSFGPHVRAVAPSTFVDEIKTRLMKQMGM